MAYLSPYTGASQGTATLPYGQVLPPQYLAPSYTTPYAGAHGSGVTVTPAGGTPLTGSPAQRSLLQQMAGAQQSQTNPGTSSSLLKQMLNKASGEQAGSTAKQFSGAGVDPKTGTDFNSPQD